MNQVEIAALVPVDVAEALRIRRRREELMRGRHVHFADMVGRILSQAMGSTQ